MMTVYSALKESAVVEFYIGLLTEWFNVGILTLYISALDILTRCKLARLLHYPIGYRRVELSSMVDYFKWGS